MSATKSSAVGPPALAWWRFGHVWLVLAGPAIVVVAGITTAVIAARGADALVDMTPRTTDVARQAPAERAALPAHQARNHAATPTASRHAAPLAPER